MPSVFKSSAVCGHSLSGFRSLSATVEPPCARNRALAMPLRAAPITKAFLPAISIDQPQTRGGAEKEREQTTDERGYSQICSELICVNLCESVARLGISVSLCLPGQSTQIQ